jgi:hypothetical protein
MASSRIQELVSQIAALKMEQHQLRTKVQFAQQARQRQERRIKFLDATSLLEKSVAVANPYNLNSATLFLCVELGRRPQRCQHDWRHLINSFASSNTFPDTTSRCFNISKNEHYFSIRGRISISTMGPTSKRGVGHCSDTFEGL